MNYLLHRLLKHETRLLKYFDSVKGRDLGERLSLSVIGLINGKPILIKHLSVETPKGIKFSTDLIGNIMTSAAR